MNQNTLNKLQQFSKANEPMKVELSLVGDIRNEMNSIGDGVQQAFNRLSQIDVILQKSLADTKRLLPEVDNGLKMAKDLGADSLVSELQGLASDLKSNVNFIQDAIKKIKAIG